MGAHGQLESRQSYGLRGGEGGAEESESDDDGLFDDGAPPPAAARADQKGGGDLQLKAMPDVQLTPMPVENSLRLGGGGESASCGKGCSVLWLVAGVVLSALLLSRMWGDVSAAAQSARTPAVAPAVAAAAAAPTPAATAVSAPTAAPLRRAKVGLDTATFTSVSQVLLSLGSAPGDMLVRWTVAERPELGRNCSALGVEGRDKGRAFVVQAWPESAAAGVSGVQRAAGDRVGCIVSWTEEGGRDQDALVWHFFVATLRGLVPAQRYTYEVGEMLGESASAASAGAFSATFRAVPADPRGFKVLAVGDTDKIGRAAVFEAIARDHGDANVLIHVGDMSYASNNGRCYGEWAQHKCAWDCLHTDKTCSGRERQTKAQMSKWVDFWRDFQPIAARIPVLTSMGNHDNDLSWFLKFRPPHNTSHPGVREEEKDEEEESNVKLFLTLLNGGNTNDQQGMLNELLSEPHFYSVDAGPVHIAAIKTEDNGVNPYEMRHTDDIALTPEERARFDRHFGPASKQFKWLERDLATVDRRKTPIVVLFTHRPWLHTSTHHPSCSNGGDWYACEFRKLYAPLLQKHNVTLLLNGHSHHYSRSHPIEFDALAGSTGNAAAAPQGRHAPVYAIVGAGGFELSNGFDPQPPWLAFREGNEFGFGLLTVADAEGHSSWQFFGVRAGAVIDAVQLM
jgi:hypothetical protein